MGIAFYLIRAGPVQSYLTRVYQINHCSNEGVSIGASINIKVKEVIIMSKSINNSTVIRPYTNKQLLKWSTMVPVSSDKTDHIYELKRVSLQDLVKQPKYESFKDRLNWLYNNFTAENYDLVWCELSKRHESIKQGIIYKYHVAKIEYAFNKALETATMKFGKIPAWIGRLPDEKRAIWLRYARVCFGLEPETISINTKEIYTVPKSCVKDYTDWGNPIYYTKEELGEIEEYISVFGRYTFNKVLRVAEDAVIRDCAWMKQFNDTENDLRVMKSVEGDENENLLVPISDPYADDAEERYSVDEVFVDFLEPLYSDDAE